MLTSTYHVRSSIMECRDGLVCDPLLRPDSPPKSLGWYAIIDEFYTRMFLPVFFDLHSLFVSLPFVFCSVVFFFPLPFVLSIAFIPQKTQAQKEDGFPGSQSEVLTYHKRGKICFPFFSQTESKTQGCFVSPYNCLIKIN